MLERRTLARNETSLPAPFGGWNTRDAISDMPSTDAIRFTNMISDENGVRVRDGYTHHAHGGQGNVEFLKNFDTPYGPRFYSCTGGELVDITSTSAVSLKTGCTRSNWKSGAMNGFLAMVNGADDPIAISYAPSTGSVYQPLPISGIAAPERLSIIHIFKSRSYFATGDEPAFYYSAVNALGGLLTRFPLDRVSNSGGNVIDIKSWTVDGGNGPDDYFVAFLQSGEVLAYQGSDPSNANDWAIVGRFTAGKIITVEQFSGQIHAVTSFDYNVFPRDFQTQGLAPPSKLVGAAQQAVREKSGLSGWQILFVPHLGLRIINVPVDVSHFEQHVLNLNNGTPAHWTIRATRWEVFNGRLYFGSTDGNISVFGGSTDEGAAIPWEFATAPARLGGGAKVNVLEYRSVVSGDGELSESTGLGYDYQLPEFIQDSTTEALGTPWNTSPWDTSSWSQNPQTRSEWLTAVGSGQTVQYYSRGEVNGFTPTWHSIDYAYEAADIH
jgi:hypothetical protein